SELPPSIAFPFPFSSIFYPLIQTAKTLSEKTGRQFSPTGPPPRGGPPVGITESIKVLPLCATLPLCPSVPREDRDPPGRSVRRPQFAGRWAGAGPGSE